MEMSIKNQEGNENDKLESVRDSPKNGSRVTIEYLYNPNIDLIGSGCSGNVYKVRKKRNTSGQEGPEYALKIFNKSDLKKENDKGARLLNEIKIHRALNHEHICKYEHSFEDKKNVYILMELCQGGTMADYLKIRKSLEEYEIRYYMFQVLSVLKYLRREKIVHRDLTLGNIFLKDYKTIKIGDFGFAYKETENDEKSYLVCGTPTYYAPESANSKYSDKTDIFGFGICIYYLFGGKSFFYTAQECAEKFSNKEIPFDQNLKFSSQALDLLKKTVTTENQRIDLDEIYSHPFFNKGKGLSKKVNFPKLVIDEKNKEINKENKEKFVKALKEIVEKEGLLLNPIKKEKNNINSSDGPNSNESLHRIIHRNNSGYQSGKNVSFINSQNNKTNRTGNIIVSSSGFKNAMKKQESSKISDAFGENVRKSWAKTQLENQLHLKKSSIKKNNTIIEENKPSILRNKKEDLKEKNDNYLSLIKDSKSDIFIAKDSSDIISIISKKTDKTESNIENKINQNKQFIYITNIIDNLSDSCSIGYLLNNKNIGVFFNDDSQIIKIYDNSKYIYYCVKDYSLNQVKITKNYLPLKDNTSDMKKKISYLIYVIDEFVKKNKLRDIKKWKFNNKLTDNNNEKNEEDNKIYLEKYKRTKNAHFFILSNKNIQVIYLDNIKIIFTCYEPKKITYINRNDEILYFPVNEHFSEFKCEDKEIKKRIHYAIKEIKK
jgi:serine/threonine protein kinase